MDKRLIIGIISVIAIILVIIIILTIKPAQVFKEAEWEGSVIITLDSGDVIKITADKIRVSEKNSGTEDVLEKYNKKNIIIDLSKKSTVEFVPVD